MQFKGSLIIGNSYSFGIYPYSDHEIQIEFNWEKNPFIYRILHNRLLNLNEHIVSSFLKIISEVLIEIKKNKRNQTQTN